MFSQLKRKWIAVFISVALLIGLLAAGFHVVLLGHYYKLVELGKTLAIPRYDVNTPWIGLVVGTLGFVIAGFVIVLFFVRLLQERRLNQLQTEFLAAVTHELKTPIATLELTSSLLRDGGVSPEESDKLWDSHQHELKRLREDVESLLEAARLQTSPTKLRTTPVPLEEWLTQSIERWKTALGPQAVLERKGDKLPERTLLDLRTLNLITDNILDNARKFARGRPQVIIRTQRLPAKTLFGKPRWKIEFQDHGWGFDPKDRKKIFERFIRAKSSAPYSIAGTGLGLFLARAASSELGIKLRGENQGRGKGATFILEGKEKTA